MFVKEQIIILTLILFYKLTGLEIIELILLINNKRQRN